MQRRTRFGKQFLHASWIRYELSALQNLHAAGADVPQPFASASNAILMDYIGDEYTTAPTLNTVKLSRNEADRLFERVLHNIRIMLSNEIIHGDLSAYNILYWDGEITLIDFPQVVNPYRNRSALDIFTRDITRICDYFSHQGLDLDPHQLTMDLWFNHFQHSPEEMFYEVEEDEDMDT